MTEWRWTDDRGVQRLVGTEELRAALASNVLAPSTLVWREGMNEWAPASTLPELSADAPIVPKPSADTPRPPRSRATPPPPPPPPPPPRGTIPTLVGMPTPENDRNAPPASLAIVVPTPGNTPEPGRAVITQIPRYAAGTELEGGAPDIPKAPRLPAPSGLKERARPQRKVTTSEIDGLWAVPSSDTDDDYTLPLERSSTPADAPAGGPGAASSPAGPGPMSSPAGGPVTIAYPAGGPGAQPVAKPAALKPVPVRAVNVKPAPGPADNGKPRPDATSAPDAKKPPTGSIDDDATLLIPPKAAAEDSPPNAQGQAKAAATSAEQPPAQAQASTSPKAEPGSPGAASPVAAGGKGPEAAAPHEHAPRAARAAAPAKPEAAGALRETGAAAEISAPKLGSVRPIPFGKPREITGGKAPTYRPPPPPPPRPIKPPPSKLPPPLPPKRSSMPPAPEGGAPAKLGPLPPPPPLPRSTRPPRPPRREDAASVAPIPALRVPAIPSEDAPIPMSADAETPRPPQTPLPKQAETREPADATDKPSPKAASPSPLPAAPAAAITLAATEPSEELSLETIEPESVRSPEAGEHSPSPLPEPHARPSPRPPPENAAQAKPIAATDGAEEPPTEPAKQLDAKQLEAKQLDKPVSVPVSSLLGAGGALIFMVISAFFVGRCSAKTPPLVARPALHVIPAIVRATLPEPPKPCWVVRQPVMWAPMASKSIPFDVVATAQGSLAIGYARDENHAIGIEVTPATGQVQPRFDQRVKSDIERVTPMPSAEFQVITQDSGGALTSAVPVPAATPFFIGIQGGSLALADRPDSAPTALWPLSGKEGISAARVQLTRDQGYGLTFRREGSIWSGWIGPDRKPAGSLSRVPGSGGAVGKPNSGWNRREFAVIFADRPEGSDRWEIRVGHAPTGQIPSATSVIPLPKGGPGGDAFAPDIAGLLDGRWLLVWTEGPAGSRAIRAQTFAHDFTPIGDPIALSPPAGNFGQGVLGVVDNYAGAVFLSKGASNYELWGSILQCG